MPINNRDHLLTLGRLVANGQVLECVLGIVLAEISGMSEETARSISQRTNASTLINLIKDSTDDAAIRAWAKATYSSLLGRNRFVHGLWSTDRDGGNVHQAHKGKVELIPDSAAVVNEAANDLADRIKEAAHLFSEVLAPRIRTFTQRA